MTEPLRLLLLEDSEIDAQLNQHALKKAQIEFTAKRVESREAFLQALDQFQPDLILADYHLPHFDGMAALKLLRQTNPDTPFIFVSGAMGEDMAVDSLHQGADDYLIKDRLHRLPSAVTRALTAAGDRQRLRQAEQALRASEEQFRSLVEASLDWIWEVDTQWRFLYSSPRSLKLLGYESEDILGRSLLDLLDSQTVDSVKGIFDEALLQQQAFTLLQTVSLSKDGQTVYLESNGVPVFGEDDTLLGFRGVSRDISQRLADHLALKYQADRAAVLLRLPSIAEIEDEKTFMQQAQELVEDLTGSRISFIHFVNADEESIELVTWSRRTLSEYCQAAYDKHYPVSQAGIWADALRQRQAVMFNDYETYPHKRGLPEGHSVLKRLISVPVIENGKVVMMTGVGNKSVDYTAQDVESVQLISNDIWRIVQRRRTQQLAVRYSQAIEQSSNEIYIFDADNLHFVEANLGARTNLGYSMEELRHMTPLDIKPEMSVAGFEDLVAPLRSGKEKRVVFKTEHRRKDGSRYPVEVFLELTGDDKPLFIAVVQDISERLQAEAKIQRLNKLYAALSQCNEAIVRASSQQALFQVICEVAVRDGGMKMAWIGLLDTAKQRVKVAAVYGTGMEYLDGIEMSTVDDHPFGLWPTGIAIRENRPYWCQDYQHDAATVDFPEQAKQFNWGAAAALPLLRAGVPIGNLTLFTETSHAFDEEARNLLLEMATDISFALENFDREAKRKQTVSSLAESEQRFRSLIEQSVAGAYIIQDDKFSYVNPRFAEILGYAGNVDLQGMNPLDVVSLKDRQEVGRQLAEIITGKSHTASYIFTAIRQDGVGVDVGINCSLSTYLGRPAIIGLMQDITDRKVAQLQISRYATQLQIAFMQTVGLATMLSEMRDPYTAGHERRVAEIAVAIGQEMGLDTNKLEGLRVGGYLHDVGKTAIPLEILVKPGKISAIEYELIKCHPQAGYDVLKDVEFPWEIAKIALQHHERIDGSGYPKGLTGSEMLLEAKIIAVADVIEAMASHRPYRPGLGIGAALEEIELHCGLRYDPEVVDACLRVFREKGFQLSA
ncbi:hypothetical protein A1359_18170 [Methylomonas lenta]|uniref:PAS domain S-box protein n=1 Tax=Methylomonas lenta TaxID=980561 RepID=A0A177MXA3_9GAMM|nr:PAS domain S-box protein [Methylomonas lenta]OAI09903.1 hypothetical protein A1359_18170 [Methylomonas lenta]